MSSRKNRRNATDNTAAESAAVEQHIEETPIVEATVAENVSDNVSEQLADSAPVQPMAEDTSSTVADETDDDDTETDESESKLPDFAAFPLEAVAIFIGKGNRPHEVARNKKGALAVSVAGDVAYFRTICGRSYQFTREALATEIANLCDYCADDMPAPEDAPEPKEPKTRKAAEILPALTFEEQVALEQRTAEERRTAIQAALAAMLGALGELPEWPTADGVVEILQTATKSVRASKPGKTGTRTESAASTSPRGNTVTLLGKCPGVGVAPTESKTSAKGVPFGKCSGCERWGTLSKDGVLASHPAKKSAVVTAPADAPAESVTAETEQTDAPADNVTELVAEQTEQVTETQKEQIAA